MAVPQQAPFRIVLGGQMPLDALHSPRNTRFHPQGNQAIDRFIRYVLLPFKPAASSITSYTASNAPNPAHTIRIPDSASTFILATNSDSAFILAISLRDARLQAFVEECGGTPTLTAFRNHPNPPPLFVTLAHPHINHAYQVLFRTSPRSGGYMYFYTATIRSVVTFLDDYIEANDELNHRFVVFASAPRVAPEVTPRRRRVRSADYRRRRAAELANQ